MEYPTATDQRDQAGGRRCRRGLPDLVEEVDGGGERAVLIRRVAELHTERQDKLAEIIKARRWANPSRRASARLDFSAKAIFEYFADNAETFPRRRTRRVARR